MNNLFYDGGFNTSAFLNSLGNLLLAVIVLIIGYFIAKAIGTAVEKLLKKTGVIRKYGSPRSSTRMSTATREGKEGESKNKWPPEKIAGKIVFWILMVFVFILFFNILNLNIIASPLVDMMSTILAFIPNVLTAALVLLLAYVIALVLKFLVVKVGSRLVKNRKVQESNYVKDRSNLQGYVENAGTIVFYIVLLMFLPGILGALGIEAVSGPFSGMLESFLAFIPRLVAAALIFVVGWIVAKIVRDIVTNFLHAIGTDKLGSKLGLSNFLKDTSISSIVGTVVFILIMIPVTVSALDQLQIAGITEPAINMLNDAMAMIPNIIIAIILILVGLWIGKWARRFVSDLLARLSFNNVTSHLRVGGWKASGTSMTPADIVGYLVQIVIVILFIVEAFNVVGLSFLVDLGTAVLAFLPSVITAIVILGLGIILGNIVKRVLDSLFSGSELSMLSSVAKYAIMALALFMALDQLGVADTIVNSAFILILGAVALAFGLAFGLGGRDNASRYLDKLERKAANTEINTEKAKQTREDIKRETREESARYENKSTSDHNNRPVVNDWSQDEKVNEDLSNDTSAWENSNEDLSNDTSAWDDVNSADDFPEEDKRNENPFAPDDFDDDRRS
ncbi:mechanosensitive ion channel [Jeotgalibacillus aurantiacus]|uniref:mechanosensitive ion channel n=1 Tax=Jeotgalibacillus aurantiacus TaxID=2763266 RepID=UPI001D0B2706|nr:mechanosensitive ion channel [Jeotgalibacillus aurantiacus]